MQRLDILVARVLGGLGGFVVNPANPIGDRWIGLEGIDEATRHMSGYGIHGTNEPQSIGQQSSMGCIRMLAQDVEVVYDVLMERMSTVEIRH